MDFQENVGNVHISDSLDASLVRLWWKGFHRVVTNETQRKNSVVSSVGESNQDFFEYTYVLKSAAILITKGDQERKCRIISYVIETEPGLKTLITFLNNENCQNLHFETAAILRESVNPKHGKLRVAAITQTLSCTYLQFFLDVLVGLHCKHTEACSREDKSANQHLSAIVNYLWFLSALAQKDNKFAVKIGILSKVKFVHELLQKAFFCRAPNSHFPVLKILRQLSRNTKVSLILGNDKIMKTVKKMFSYVDKEPTVKSQMFLDVIVHLTKEKVNSRRFLQAGCLPSIVRCFQYFSMNWKGKPLYKLSKATVAIYTQISRTKMGRNALVQSEALTDLNNFLQNCPKEKGFHLIIIRSCALIFYCYGVFKLPVNNVYSPVRFVLPHSEFSEGCMSISEVSGESSEDEDGDNEDEEESNSDDSGTEDSDEKGKYSFTDTETDDGSVHGDDASDDDDKPKIISEISNDTNLNRNNANHNNNNIPISIEQKDSDAQWLLEFSRFFKEFDNDEKIFVNELSTKQIHSFNRRSTRENRRPSMTNKVDNKLLNEFGTKGNLESNFIKITNNIRSVINFVKIPYPDLKLAESTEETEFLNNPTEKLPIREKLLKEMARVAGPEHFNPNTVYDIDYSKLLRSRSTSITGSYKGKTNSNRRNSKDFRESLANNDESQVGILDNNLPLKFESRFESGNLRKAIQIDQHEYDLILMSDVNSNTHNQWFYFQISNIEDKVDYTLNVINCIKGSSQFNQGMQPVMFSVADAISGKPGWVRCGTNICYFKNGYRNTTRNKNKPYYSVSFTMNFKNRGDIVYIAYHMPYTYSRLLTELEDMTKISKLNQRIIFRCDILCQTLNRNDVPLITITAAENEDFPISSRELIFITSRVHPGESNASWIMHGVLSKLLFDPNMESLLQRFIFKIVPMLNVEGVLNGCTRCELTAEDLNRKWKTPNKNLNPTIYYSRMLLQYYCKVKGKSPVVYCDFHGHSKKKNLFLYGCSFARSWSSEDRMRPEDPQAIHELPEALSKRVPALSLSLCNYEVRQSRESTARVAVWRDFNVIRSYTLECSYCGCDEGFYKGICFGTKHLLQIGEGFCESLGDLFK